MAHLTSKSYYSLQKRLDKAAQGAPASKTLYKILEMLFSEEEAELASVLPMNFFTSEEVMKIWKKSKKETEKVLNSLADKGILFDVKKGKTTAYFLSPPMAGFFEFSLMRTGGKLNKKLLSKLFFQYINVEDKFIKKLFLLNPNIGRVFVQEDSIHEDHKALVLDYEKASKIINSASSITAGTCYCRHKMEHLGKACDNPQKVCLTLNRAAESLARHKIAKKISKKEALKILKDCSNLGLVHFGENAQEGVNFICNCCSCCCEALQAYKRFGYKGDISSNFVSMHSHEDCVGCGVCVEKCPVDAIKLVGKKKHAKVLPSRCIGCGVCVKFCPTKSRVLEKKKKTRFVPKDSFERMLLEAINSGKLKNYLFDNPNILSHSILRKIISVILSLPAAKRLAAQKQLRSRFMNAMMKTEYYEKFEKFFKQGKKEYGYSHPELKQ